MASCIKCCSIPAYLSKRNLLKVCVSPQFVQLDLPPTSDGQLPPCPEIYSIYKTLVLKNVNLSNSNIYHMCCLTIISLRISSLPVKDERYDTVLPKFKEPYLKPYSQNFFSFLLFLMSYNAVPELTGRKRYLQLYIFYSLR